MKLTFLDKVNGKEIKRELEVHDDFDPSDPTHLALAKQILELRYEVELLKAKLAGVIK